jgi:hypothetical protein
MLKIIVQAGHESRTSGSTGAPNEQSFNVDVSNQVAEQLRNLGVEVKRVNADPKAAEIAGDWDLFLAIHYDADVYGKGGYFVDFPEPSTDGATVKSQAICKALCEAYGAITGIVNHPERSNKNTRFYYMWDSISAKTPCVLIECGVGMHTPDDHAILHMNRPLVVKGIVDGLKKALNIQSPTPPVSDPHLAEIVKLNEKIKDLETNHKSLSERLSQLEGLIATKDEQIASGESQIRVLTEENQKLVADVEYYKPYKSRYEEALTKVPNSMTGWQLIRLGINKLKAKK